MLAFRTVLEVKNLLDKGMSQRKIALKLGVGRATIGAIASGKRGLHGRLESPGTIKSSNLGTELAGDFERCPECGAKVILPCLGCGARRFHHRERDLSNKAA